MLLLPIMPATCEKIFKHINLDVKTLKDLDIIPTVEIDFKKPENLFNKIDE
ncbi:MAG: hypothetical protein PHG49_00515 [Candidatus Pacebacteria bacterium]|nr:hypothetical protein [Candidatus Paceibacterota bacterium]